MTGHKILLLSNQILNSVKVLHDSWTLHHVFEGLASGSEGCEEGDS